MTATAGIEIGTGLSNVPGTSKVSGIASGNLAAGTATSVFTSSTASAGQDFRSGLQSLLAALGAISDSAAEPTGGRSSSLISASASAVRAGRSSHTNSAQALRTNSLQEQGLATEKDAEGQEKLISAQVATPASANRLATGTASAEPKSKSEEKKTTTKSANESSATSQGSDSISSVQLAGIAAETLPGTLKIASAASLQADPGVAVAGSAFHRTDGAALPTQTALTLASLPAPPAGGFTTASEASPQIDSEAAIGSIEAADSAVRQGTESDGSSLKPERPLTTSDLASSSQSGSSEVVLQATELPDTRMNALPAGATLLKGGEPAVQAVQNFSSPFDSEMAGRQGFTQNECSTVEPSQTEALTVDSAQSTNPAPDVASSLHPSSTSLPSQETVPAFGPNQVVADGVDAEQRALPAAIENSGSAQSNAADLSQSELPRADAAETETENSFQSTAVHRPSSESSALPLNSGSSVEASQSIAFQRTATSGTILNEAKNSASVRLPSHSESAAEQAVNQAPSQLNPSQPLAVTSDPVQVVASEVKTSPATASSLGANTAMREPQQRDALPALTDTLVVNPTATTVSAVASVTGAGSSQLPNAEKLDASSNEKAAVSGVSRTTLKAKGSNAVQAGRTAVSGESSGSVTDVSAGLRELTRLQEARVTASENKSAAAAQSDSAETFAAMDSSAAPGRPAWIHAGAQQAEAGFQDPALGWVGVRADASGSGIHAQLVAGSTDAAQTLSGHMAGLNAFLAEHHTPVETLTLSTTSGGTESASDRGAGGGMQQGTGEQAGQQLAQGAASLPSSSARLSEAALSKPVWPTGLDENTQRTQWVGGHISVMA